MTEQEKTAHALQIMRERFGRDRVIALATAEDGKPHVRDVDGYYEDGSFYTVTYLASGKMRQIAKNPDVALCGEWFTGHGTGESLGWIRNPENKEMADKLRRAFAAWYDNGHNDETDPNTIILRVRLKDAVLMENGAWYALDFIKQGADKEA